MAGKVSKENAFGQDMICLKLSKLNFVLKETPYSGYITVRKQFMKQLTKSLKGCQKTL